MDFDLTGLLGPLVKPVLKYAVKPIIQRLIDIKPERGKMVVASFYMLVDVELEPVVQDTSTGLDNSGVDALKEMCEELAVDNNFTLSNVDDD